MTACTASDAGWVAVATRSAHTRCCPEAAAAHPEHTPTHGHAPAQAVGGHGALLRRLEPEHEPAHLHPLRLVVGQERAARLALHADAAELVEDHADVQVEQRVGHHQHKRGKVEKRAPVRQRLRLHPRLLGRGHGRLHNLCRRCSAVQRGTEALCV